MKTFHRTVVFSTLLLCSCGANSSDSDLKYVFSHNSTSDIKSKINGASIVAPSHPVDDAAFRQLASLHVNFICLLPFAYVKEGNPEVRYNKFFQWWGEKPEGIAECIRMAKLHNMSVIVKPQLWISDGLYTGDLKFANDEEWQVFEQTYYTYLLTMLTVADSMDADWFCVGTELGQFVKNRSSFWSSLIDSARKHFRGRLTYAENWDNYESFPHWNKLDAIGINAYFPLSDSLTPSVAELENGWQPHFSKMKSFSETLNKSVMFTEYGYRSIDYAARTPWESYSDEKVNMIAQKNAYEAFFHTFWKEPWVAGGFFWKWFDANTHSSVPLEKDYSPQEKPAAEVIKKWYEIK